MGYKESMRRTLITCLLVISAAFAAAASATATNVRVTDMAPFTVRGAAFHALERVRVSVTTPEGARAIQVRATSAGTFVARFPAVHFGSCAAYTVRATGAQGSRATLRVMPECPPPIAP